LVEARRELRILDRAADFGSDLVDDVVGSSRRRHQPIPGEHVEIGKTRFGDGRNVRQLRRARFA